MVAIGYPRGLLVIHWGGWNYLPIGVGTISEQVSTFWPELMRFVADTFCYIIRLVEVRLLADTVRFVADFFVAIRFVPIRFVAIRFLLVPVERG